MSIDKSLVAGSELLTKLTGNRVFLLFITGIIGIFLYTVFENRAVVAKEIVGNIMLQGALGVAMIVMFISYFFQRLQNRVDEKTEHIHVVLKERIDDLEHQITDMRERERLLTTQFSTLGLMDNKLDDIHEDVKHIRRGR
jgi:cell division protein FtsL